MTESDTDAEGLYLKRFRLLCCLNSELPSKSTLNAAIYIGLYSWSVTHVHILYFGHLFSDCIARLKQNETPPATKIFLEAHHHSTFPFIRKKSCWRAIIISQNRLSNGPRTEFKATNYQCLFFSLWMSILLWLDRNIVMAWHNIQNFYTEHCFCSKRLANGILAQLPQRRRERKKLW